MKGASNGWLRALRRTTKTMPGLERRRYSFAHLEHIDWTRRLEGRFLLEGVLIVGIKFIGVFRIAIGITAIKSDYPITSKIKSNLIADENIIQLLGKYYVFQIDRWTSPNQIFQRFRQEYKHIYVGDIQFHVFLGNGCTSSPLWKQTPLKSNPWTVSHTAMNVSFRH